MSSTARAAGSRQQGIDLARMLAVLAMVLWHALDAWSSPEARRTVGFAAARLIGSTALPGFLFLAGVGVALRAEAAERRGEPLERVRRALVRRAMWLVAGGYLFSAAQAAIDGASSLEAILRADVLHGIGLSLAVVAWARVRDFGPERQVRGARAALFAVALGGLLASPLVGLVTQGAEGPARVGVALLAYVPGLSRAPLLPVVSLVAAGALCAPLVADAQRSGPALVALGAISVVVSAGARVLTEQTVDALGGTLTTAHPAVAFNAIDGAARAMVLVALGGGLAELPWSRVRAPLVALGRASLFAYVVHVPLCYGRLGAPLARKLGLGGALAAALVLFAAVVAAVAVRDRVRAARRARRASEETQ